MSIIAAAVSAAVLSAVFYIVIYAASSARNTVCVNKKIYLRAAAVSFMLSVILSAAVTAAAELFGGGVGVIPAAITAGALSLGVCAAVSLRTVLRSIGGYGAGGYSVGERSRGEAFRLAAADAAIALVVIILLELGLFNYSAYSSPKGQEEPLLLSCAEIDGNPVGEAADRGESQAAPAVVADDVLRIISAEPSTAVLPCRADFVQNVRIAFAGGSGIIGVSVCPASADGTPLGESAFVECSARGDAYISVNSRGAKFLKFTFTDALGTEISAIAVNAERHIRVNILRMALLWGAAALIFVIIRARLYRLEYDPKSAKQTAVLAVLLCAAAAIAVGIFALSGADALTEYSGGDATGRDAYYQMFDALQKGQAELDVQVDERLTAAGELAYDPQYREENGIVFEWDRAFYGGKYYSYFGLAPLFLFYYPIYFISGALPTLAAACAFFALLAAVFGFWLVLQIARRAVGGANFMLTAALASLMPLVSGVYILEMYSDFYSVPKLCGMAFLLLLAVFTLKGYDRPLAVTFLICGLSVGGILASRPNMILPALGLAPLYIGVLMKKDVGAGRKTACVVAFLLPAAATAGALMMYNCVRFGSPWEFGAKYQLTVSDIAQNNISPAFFGAAMYHYFLQLPQFFGRFPFVSPSARVFENYPRFFYITASFGIFAYPINLSVAALPFVSRKSKMKTAVRATLPLTLLLCIAAAFLDYCLAGVTISYVCDMAPLFFAVTAAVLLSLEKQARGRPLLHKIVFAAVWLLAAVTAFLGVMLALSTDPFFVKNELPEIYGALQNVFAI